MQTDILWFWPIEKGCLHGFANVGAKLIPCVSLGEDAFAESLRSITPVGFLKNFKDKFLHAATLAKIAIMMKRRAI